MSTEAIAHAFGQRLPGVEKWTLVCLARFADEWGYSVFPAFEELADKTGFSKMTCRRTVRELQKLDRVRCIADATPVSPAFYYLVGVPEPEQPRTTERHCPAALKRAVLFVFDLRCEYCGEVGTKELGPDGKAWQIDRVRPDLRGGTYSPDNVTLSCKTCTNKKKSKPAPAGTRTLTLRQPGQQGGIQSVTPPPGAHVRPPGDQPVPPGDPTRSLPGHSLVPDLSDLSSDHVADPEKTGAAPRRLDEPVENLSVITKLAHEVLELFAETADVTEREVVDGIERRCDLFNIANTRDLVYRAIASAVYQRRRAGKTPVLPSTAGDAAFRLKEPA